MEKKGIFLTNRHVSWVLSCFIITSFFIFISGYFLGKKKAVEKFYNKVDQDSLADHIYYSVCSIYDTEESSKQESTEDLSNDLDSAKNNVACQDSSRGISDMQNVAKIEESKKTQLQEKEVGLQVGKTSHENFYAELIGFGTLRAANNFAEKLKKQGFSVAVRRRISRTAKKKRITWYQVITEKFDNKSDLMAFVDIIKDKERLKGVRIVQC